MITEKRKWMTYTYFHRNPNGDTRTTHLFSFLIKKIPMMVRVDFPTMVVQVESPDFVKKWSSSTRTKINKAIKEGLTVDRGNYLLPDILKLFSASAAGKGLRGYTLDDFGTKSNYECSAVFYEGVMLCGHVWLIDREEKRALLFVNASNHNQYDNATLTGCAHYFLLWQDGLFLHQQAIRILDLMGYVPDTKNAMLKGVYQWKAGTHGSLETLYHYYPVWFYVLRKFRNMLAG
jgi:hypothetical protein